ncbi:hypothetical protein NPIL_619521 [Nephila pilipes]|uniref:Uncharacterized protein n=1 Tax=Nephila pilipes TaxID=299642 RepID=A0A8X6NVA7_NEPPI|nr:hypothetical protein NPIL_619521 [Nephila pilipes]
MHIVFSFIKRIFSLFRTINTFFPFCAGCTALRANDTRRRLLLPRNLDKSVWQPPRDDSCLLSGARHTARRRKNRTLKLSVFKAQTQTTYLLQLEHFKEQTYLAALLPFVYIAPNESDQKNV